MDVKKVALLIGALVIAVVTAVMAKNMFTGAGAESANAAPVVPAGPKVLVAKKPIDDKTSELIVKTVRAMQSASAALVKDPEGGAAAIQKQFFAKADPESITAAVKALTAGVAGGGRLDVQNIRNQLMFSKEVGIDFGKDFDAAVSQNDLWTNSFVERAGNR